MPSRTKEETSTKTEVDNPKSDSHKLLSQLWARATDAEVASAKANKTGMSYSRALKLIPEFCEDFNKWLSYYRVRDSN
ncbi:MAG: hypothetical protein P0S95_06990 [Rhabdochlamydiaceae bacterium]|nr:hypothetical protein [Candidatus Amphrikana amoebophyrae]